MGRIIEHSTSSMMDAILDAELYCTDGLGTEGASRYAPGITVNLSGKSTVVGRNSGECAEEAPPKGYMIVRSLNR